MGLFLHNNPLWTLDVESTVRPCREWAESWGALKPTVLPAWAHLPPHTPGGGGKLLAMEHPVVGRAEHLLLSPSAPPPQDPV